MTTNPNTEMWQGIYLVLEQLEERTISLAQAKAQLQDLGMSAEEADEVLDGNTHDEESCRGHVASEHDPKVCGRCGVHIDSLRP
jgi:hypothetical protein